MDNSSLPTYQSAHIAVTIMMQEYSNEESRKGVLENKAITLITILIGFISFYIPLTPWDKLQTICDSKIPVRIIFMTFFLLCFIAALVLVAYCFIGLIKMLDLKTYFRVSTDELTNENVLAVDEDIYEYELCQHYQNIITKNCQVNDEKCVILIKSFRIVIISFLLLLTSCIGLKIV